MVHSGPSSKKHNGTITLADTHYSVGTQLITIKAEHNPNNSNNRHICKVDPDSCKATYQVNETVAPVFSVIRTGTGSLDLLAGGSIEENSDYGIYTAGAQSAPILNADGVNTYDLAQGMAGQGGTLLGSKNAAIAALAADYRANYPAGGGNVLVAAQANLNGFIESDFTPANEEFQSANLTSTDAVGAWLWRQGGAGNSTAWWIEFGALEPASNTAKALFVSQVDGFQVIGTLGGGNLTVDVGGNASGLNLAVGATGRVTTAVLPVETGGGMDVRVAGRINAAPSGGVTYAGDQGGVLADLRGDTVLGAAAVGAVLPNYIAGQENEAGDTRVLKPLTTETATVEDGIELVPGDGTVTIDTTGDLVIDGAGNPGTEQNLVNLSPTSFTANGKSYNLHSGATADFSLWSPRTGLDLFSAGGNVAPSEAIAVGSGNASADADSNTAYYPASLSAISQNGDIDFIGGTVELAPAPDGQLELLAADSVLGAATFNGFSSVVAISGAPLSAVATPADPAVSILDQKNGKTIYTNVSPNSNSLLLAFAADTPAGALHADDKQPALVYAGSGDIVDLQFGLTASNPAAVPAVQYVAAKPFNVVAGQDIVNSGTPTSPNVFLNLGGNDITTVAAARDILQSSFDIAGHGFLVVQAGRNLYEGDSGTIDSIGPIFDIDPNDRNSGAGVTVLAGVGANGPDYAGFTDAFLNPASTLELENAAQIVGDANDALVQWLRANFGYTGAAASAYDAFLKLPSASRNVFLRQLYFDELNQAGLEFNDPSSVRYKSYVRSRDAIATLFPAEVAGAPTTYSGAIILFGGSGIHTDFGGTIQALTPGGETIVGVEGTSPPASAGLVTQGSGDIDIYSLGSVLLGESRVLTTFGGNIVIWSAAGDINAGRGSKTTVDYTPVQRIYDIYGNVSLSPTLPSSGAGIATLNPIPTVAPGNINLIAPLGTIDAGEAGIRVSGNLNIAALHVVDAANISVQGSATGVPVSVAPNVSVLTSASNASGAAVQAAEKSAAPAPPAALPSVWIVEILSYGGSSPAPPPPASNKKKPLLSARNDTNVGMF